MSKVKIDALSKVVMEELKQYGQLASDDVKEIVKEVADDVKKEISATAPKDSGKYAKSFAIQKTKQSATSLTLTVHSKNKYQLTHLLEFGHVKRNGGRVTARPHIAKAEEKGIKDLEEKIKEKLQHG